MKQFIIGLLIVGLAASVLGVLCTVDPSLKGTWLEVGKPLMAFGATVFVGGAVASWLKLYEHGRDDKKAWAQLLEDIVEAHQQLSVACQLINAHKTAKTYSLQNGKICEIRATLRRVSSHPLVEGDRPKRNATSVKAHLDAMQKYVDDLGQEYEEKYLRASRQQLIDEQYLKLRIAALVTNPNPRMIFDPKDQVYQPTRSWQTLRTFPHLRHFMRNFTHSRFEESFQQLRKMLAERAGVKARSPWSERWPLSHVRRVLSYAHQSRSSFLVRRAR
ncbi:hypothetical protein PHK61_31545 [Actinomycetospora lutea]|uniref:hypothetical protein n=1 Tax=Actinomycetospora lutea TaxID=663604 RepID=UPI0023654E41|nr:hypothetical protein [Actinomycetospora lutea]MDD7942951.1 hypothetical protein [Actinomycetospora lutea]